MKVHPIEAFSDNYIWVIEKGSQAVVVDPGEGQVVLDYLEEKGLDLHAILLTHNHDDHVGGVLEIYEEYPDVFIVGPEETEPIINRLVKDGDSFDLFGQRVAVFLTSGHTDGHISYLIEDKLFCGDALFSAGCGRVFTRDYEAQYQALQFFNELEEAILVYAGHEYTETNLKFAREVHPYSQTILEALKETMELRARDLPSLPSTIKREKEINVFLQAQSLKEFTELRELRDIF